MKKIFAIFLLAVVSVCAYSASLTDALKLLYSKGACVCINGSLVDKGTNLTFSSVIDKEKLGRVWYLGGKVDDESVSVLKIGEIMIPMAIVKTLSSDENGNLMITLRPLTKKLVSDYDMENFFEQLGMDF